MPQTIMSTLEGPMFCLDNTPYLLDQLASTQILARLKTIENRVALLRATGTLTENTLRDYYGEKRFEQVAESNAIEGNTLSAGETELAVLKGITITGHDPAYAKDAIALDRALSRITELARTSTTPTDILQLHEIHAILLGNQMGAGLFRQVRIAIRGAKHTPPKTWNEVMTQMEQWEQWSKTHSSLPGPLRSIVLHGWLTHIHPYIDGNGRTARAIGNLELIRSGYPPIIIKRKERERYIDALAESDDGGDIRAFAELVLDRIDGGLVGLEHSARRKQDFNPTLELIRQRQTQQLQIWDTSVRLLATIIEHNVGALLSKVGGKCTARIYDTPLDLQDYIEICAGNPVSHSWAFILTIDVPGLPRFQKLAYIGHRSNRLFQHLKSEGGPSIYWSSKNPSGLPQWKSDGPSSPYANELTTLAANGNEWIALLTNDEIRKIQTTDLAKLIANAVIQQLMPAP